MHVIVTETVTMFAVVQSMNSRLHVKEAGGAFRLEHKVTLFSCD